MPDERERLAQEIHAILVKFETDEEISATWEFSNFFASPFCSEILALIQRHSALLCAAAYEAAAQDCDKMADFWDEEYERSGRKELGYSARYWSCREQAKRIRVLTPADARAAVERR